MAAARSHEFECGCKCGMKKSWVFVVVEMFIEVGTSWGLVEGMDGDEMVAAGGVMANWLSSVNNGQVGQNSSKNIF